MRPRDFGLWERLSDGSGPVVFQEFLHLNGRHAPTPSGSNGLAVAAVLHVAASVNAVHACVHVVVGFEIAIRVGIELAGKYLRVGVMPDAQKQRARRKVATLA